MSMIGNLLRIPETELKKILEDSKLLENLIETLKSENDPRLIDIDKNWEAI